MHASTAFLFEFIRRLTSLLVGLGLVAAGGWLLLHVAGWAGPMRLTRPGLDLLVDLRALPVRAVWSFVGIALLAVVGGLLFFIPALRRSGEAGREVVLSGRGDAVAYGGGRVTVALRSLQALVAYVAERVPGVREADPQVQLRRDGWHVRCRVAVHPDSPLPEVTARLREALQQTLERHTGLPVARVDVASQLTALDARRRLR
ncbi:MAG: alkaline shock response membrane anchor protein AmaP [Bacteroidetes bacterium]|nr:hypothetical protein AWN76_016950 [Rhodothermaceae bacterium RA]RMH69830.1 MAG: alkaline shock response membrane anchor protein AmaP [Bacteroidota bacterium]